MKLRIAGIVLESVVDGPGLRSVIFTQGCPRQCVGCHNPETQNLDGGNDVDLKKVITDIDAVKLISGITISGGEPLIQPEPVHALVEYYKKRGYNTMVYTGYTWEEVLKLTQENHVVKLILDYTDYVVDGPFMENMKDLNLPFRGSRNQRIIDVRESLSKNTIVNASFA